MSHVALVDVIIKDLGALEKVCPDLNLELIRDKQRYKWYGEWVNDYHKSDAAYLLGLDPKEYGKCDHVIKVPGTSYEIGLVPVSKLKNKDGSLKYPGQKGWKLVYDFYGPGREIKSKYGQKLEKIVQAYGVKAAQRWAMKQGKTATKTVDKKTGIVNLVIQ